MKKVLLIVFGLFLVIVSRGQNGLKGDGFNGITTAWNTLLNFDASAGSSRILTTKSTSTTGSYFRLVRNWSSDYTEYGPNNSCTTDVTWDNPGIPYNLAACNSKAMRINCPNTTDNYVFKTPNANTANSFVYFRIQGDIQSVNTISIPNNNYVAVNSDIEIQATLTNVLSSGQGVYIRYSSDNWSSSTISEMSVSGTSATFTIPAVYNTSDKVVRFSVFTSGNGLTINHSDVDWFTINAKTGEQYFYTTINTINFAAINAPLPADIFMGGDFIVNTRAYIPNITNVFSTANTGLKCWIGYNATNSNPTNWNNWVEASFVSKQDNDHVYSANLKSILPNSSNKTFYYAVKYQLNNGDIYYAGTSGQWNNDSASLYIQPFYIFGDALDVAGATWMDSEMYSTEGVNFSATVHLYENNDFMFRYRDRSNNYTYFKDDDANFPSQGTANGSNHITVGSGEGGTYLVLFERNGSNIYRTTLTNCTSDSTPVTWNGSSWDGTPDMTKKIIINGNYTTTASGLTACECQINNGFTLTVADNTYLTVAKKIENNGTIIVKNTGNVIQYSEEVNIGSGSYKVEKDTPAATAYDYVYWSSPVTQANITSVFTDNPQNYIWEFVTENYEDLHSGAYTQTTGSPDGYDDNNDDWRNKNNASFNGGSSNYTMTPGKGYIVMVPGFNTFNPANIGSPSLTPTVTFTGTSAVFNNGIITYDSNQDHTQDEYNYNNNLNFIGNPYPSAISADRFLAENSNVGTLYFWTHKTVVTQNDGPNAYDFNNDDYAQYTSAGGVASSNGGAIPTGNIASCQGFMASVADGFTGDITFNNLMRLSVNNNNFYRQANTTSDKDKIWLNLNGSDVFRQILVAFMPETTDQFDFGYDSNRLYDIYTDDFYSVLEDKRLAIQSLASFNDEIEVPLGLKIQNTGNFSISLDHTQGIFSQTQKIYLEDTQEEIIHNLGEGAYTFTQTAGTDINDRFILRFTNTQLGHEEAVLEDLKLYPNPTKGLLNIAYSGSEPLQVTLYNQVGHMVGTYEGVQVLDLSQLAQGMYFAKIANSQGSVTRKIVLE